MIISAAFSYQSSIVTIILSIKRTEAVEDLEEFGKRDPEKGIDQLFTIVIGRFRVGNRKQNWVGL
jgi:hypothetical protein